MYFWPSKRCRPHNNIEFNRVRAVCLGGYGVPSIVNCHYQRCTVFGIVILSVCLSVCHTRGLCPHGSTYDYDFFTIW